MNYSKEKEMFLAKFSTGTSVMPETFNEIADCFIERMKERDEEMIKYLAKYPDATLADFYADFSQDNQSEWVETGEFGEHNLSPTNKGFCK